MTDQIAAVSMDMNPYSATAKPLRALLGFLPASSTNTANVLSSPTAGKTFPTGPTKKSTGTLVQVRTSPHENKGHLKVLYRDGTLLEWDMAKRLLTSKDLIESVDVYAKKLQRRELDA